MERGIEEKYEAWRDEAQCSIENIPVSHFYPEKGQSLDATKVAVNACLTRCEVRNQCLQYALDNNERDGWFGGLNFTTRRTIRRLGMNAIEGIEAIDDGRIRNKVGRPFKRNTK